MGYWHHMHAPQAFTEPEWAFFAKLAHEIFSEAVNRLGIPLGKSVIDEERVALWNVEPWDGVKCEILKAGNPQMGTKVGGLEFADVVLALYLGVDSALSCGAEVSSDGDLDCRPNGAAHMLHWSARERLFARD